MKRESLVYLRLPSENKLDSYSKDEENIILIIAGDVREPKYLDKF